MFSALPSSHFFFCCVCATSSSSAPFSTHRKRAATALLSSSTWLLAPFFFRSGRRWYFRGWSAPSLCPPATHESSFATRCLSFSRIYIVYPLLGVVEAALSSHRPSLSLHTRAKLPTRTHWHQCLAPFPSSGLLFSSGLFFSAKRRSTPTSPAPSAAFSGTGPSATLSSSTLLS